MANLLLLEDGSSYLLLEDNASKLILDAAPVTGVPLGLLFRLRLHASFLLGFVCLDAFCSWVS
jgi:hypothetical protein